MLSGYFPVIFIILLSSTAREEKKEEKSKNLNKKIIPIKNNIKNKNNIYSIIISKKNTKIYKKICKFIHFSYLIIAFRGCQNTSTRTRIY